MAPVRQAVADVLLSGDEACEYPKVTSWSPASPPGFAVPGLSPLYGPLASCRFISSVRAIMLSGQEPPVMKQRMFPVLARFRAFALIPIVGSIPQIGDMLGLASGLYDLDSIVSWMLASEWMTLEEKAKFLADQKSLITGASGDFAASLQASSNDWKLADRVWQWHQWQAIPLPDPIRQVIASWGQPPPKQVTPLQWYDQNCFVQAPVQMLATVREWLSYESVMLPDLPKLMAKVGKGLVDGVKLAQWQRLFRHLLQALDVINTAPAPGSAPFPFRELYASVGECFDNSGDPMNQGGDANALIQDVKDGPSPGSLRSRYLLTDWAPQLYVRSQAGGDLLLPLNPYHGLMPLLKIFTKDMSNMFQAPSPGTKSFPNAPMTLQMAGPKLLFLGCFGEFTPGTSYQILPALRFTTFGGQDALYLLRSAMVYSGGHYSCVMHYPLPNALRPDSKEPAVLDSWIRGGSWIHCDMSACSPIPTGFEAIRGGRMNGNTLKGFIYERLY